jgi:hypothetical protein
MAELFVSLDVLSRYSHVTSRIQHLLDQVERRAYHFWHGTVRWSAGKRCRCRPLIEAYDLELIESQHFVIIRSLYDRLL